jgi:ATP-dependent RNA helicase RhlE
MITEKKIEQIINNEIKQGFGGLGIAPKMLEVLDRLNFKTPTPIQRKAIPAAIEGKDIVGIAQTGTGKTLALGIPMIQRILSSKGDKGLILLPTRELAAQINETLQKIGHSFGLKTSVLIGGASMREQVYSLRNNPDIVVGTPGRIIDHLKQKTLNFNNVKMLVLDEADLMFDMGFAPQIKEILQAVPKDRQTMLFSATMPENIVKIASNHMKLPVRVEIAKSGTAAEKVEHEVFFVKKDQKNRLLDKLLFDYKGSVLVFTRTKHGAKKICVDIRNMGILAAEIHSNRSLGQRREALEGFKVGKYRVLVATDIASRGIDVKGIELVINYDVPESAGDYVHRIGRTGRAGMSGKAISLVMPEQRYKVRDIERLIRVIMPISQLPELPAHRASQPAVGYKRENYFFQRKPQKKFHKTRY